MKKVNEMLKTEFKKDINLKTELKKELKEKDFNDFVKLLNVEETILCQNTSKLKDSFRERNNCINCRGISFCKNELEGYVYTAENNDNNITFSYKPCTYMQKYIEANSYKENIDLFNVPTSLQNAKVKDIYTDDKSRIEVIKYIMDYVQTYNEDKKKGLYLAGNFGSGKTYLIAALFNELAKKEVKSAIIYFPEFLRTLKASFNESEDGSYSDKFNYIKRVPLLLIDDIGAENLTTWARDEILGTILQYRMEENLATFFTSNLTMEELEMHLSITGSKVERVKARRIIERIKYLSDEMKLIGIDRRK